MQSIRLVLFLLFTMLLDACEPRIVQTQALSVPMQQRIAQHGYSFMPPSEKGWRLLGRDKEHIILGRYGPSPDETTIILAGNILAPQLNTQQELEQFVRKQIAKDAITGPASRFTDQTIQMKRTKQSGANCELVHQTTVDHMAKKLSSNQGNMTLEVEQLVCRHPDKVNAVTYLSYSQRYYAGKRDPDFNAKAKELLDSLEFSKF